MASPSIAPSAPGDGIRKWIAIVLVAITWIFAAGMTYGLIHSNQENTNVRLQAIETNQSDYVRRAEYETSRQDIRDQLDRIERKIDRLDQAK